MLVEPRRQRWGVLFLLFLSIAVNLVDRQVLSILAPLIRDELHLSNIQYSYILFAFLLGMAVAQVPVGLFLDRRGALRGLPLLMLWWSAANGLHAVSRTVQQFCVYRFLMGAGECGNYSGGIKVIAQWFPPEERALAGGVFNSGTVVGAFAAPPLIVAIALHFGWRAGFLLPSALGLLWIVPWLLFYRDGEAPSPSAPAVSFRVILRRREVWGAVWMRMLSGPVVHFYWYWLPEYLKRERHFSMARIGLLAGVPFLFAGLGNLAGGWFSSRLMRMGYSADFSRKLSFVLSGVLCLSSMLVPLAPGELAAIALICAATFGISAFAANHIGLLTDLFSGPVLGGLTGLTGMGEACMNMLLMLATGAVVDRFSYLPVFLAAGLLPLFGVAALFLLIRRVHPVI